MFREKEIRRNIRLRKEREEQQERKKHKKKRDREDSGLGGSKKGRWETL